MRVPHKLKSLKLASSHKYEVYKMEKGETINKKYNKFHEVVTTLKGLSKLIGKAEL